MTEDKIRDNALHVTEYCARKVGKVEALSSSALYVGQWFTSFWLLLIPEEEVLISNYKVD